ncbi:transcriptional regulator [Methylorubrum zatmanii]
MSVPKLTFVEKAQTAWGSAIPPEVITLAEFADSRSGAEAAKAIGYSPAVVSHLIANRYPGDLPTVMQKIRGALMGETVHCPVLGDLGRDQCLTEQRRPFAATNAARARVYRACRTGCPHSRLKGV